MKLLPIFATAAVCLGIGVIIGRVSSPQENASDIQEKSAKDTRERYRSARRSTTGYDDARRVGKIGGEPPVSYENRLKHMAALAKDVGGNRGIPNFDSLFGIWETAGMLDAVEILQALTDLEDSSLGQEEGMYVKAMLVMQWAKKNGPEAMDYAMSQGGSRNMMPMKEMALQAWASSDPKGAYSWYQENKDQLKPREASSFLAGTIAGLTQENFPSAFEKMKNVNSLSQRDVLTQFGVSIADNTEHRKQFTEYLMTLDNQALRTTAVKGMVGQLAENDIEEAIQFVNDWSGNDKGQLVSSVAGQWALTEPEKALNWQLSEPGMDDSIDGTFGDWARRDEESAKKWLVNQDTGVDKDGLIMAAAQRIMWDEDFPKAAQWAGSIGDEKKRLKSLKHGYRRWLDRDKKGATEWLENLDEETRKKIQP